MDSTIQEHVMSSIDNWEGASGPLQHEVLDTIEQDTQVGLLACQGLKGTAPPTS